MKLEAKLGLSTGVLMLAMLVSASVAHTRIQEANRLSAVVTEERLPLLRLARDLRFDPMMEVRALESALIFGDDPAALAQFHKERLDQRAGEQKAATLLHQLISRYDLEPETQPIRDFETASGNLVAMEEQAERLNVRHTPESRQQAIALLQNQIMPADAALYASLRPWVISEEKLRDDEVVRLGKANWEVLETLWIATGLGAIFGGLLSFLLARRISFGVAAVAERAAAIAAGDLTSREPAIQSSDQIGSLATAMEEMQKGLARIIGTVAKTAGSLNNSLASIRSATEKIHGRVDEQTQQTQQAATAMQEMSASIAEVSRHTQSAAETARSAAQTAREGGATVTLMLESMGSIATAVSETSSTIGLLGEDSHRISQIVTVIDEIATKTNLLALNAAIEAARAGEHGRGFAVVAGEVRHLAESTAQATGEISAMIQGIQTRTRTAVASMASGTQTVQQGVATTHQAGEALERIIGIAERVDRMIAQIAIAASQQAAAADQFSVSLDSIHTLSTDNLSEMATTTDGIESLRETAAALESQVERFRLDAPMVQAVAVGRTGKRVGSRLQVA